MLPEHPGAIGARPGRAGGAVRRLARYRTHLPWGATLVAIGPAGDAADHAALVALRRAGFSVVRIVLGRRSGAPSHGLPVHYVASIDDVEALNE
jgi:hypothetical protein